MICMIIRYTETKSGGILINSIENGLSWQEISELNGDDVRKSYISRMPNMTFSGSVLYIYFKKENGTIKEKRLEIGQEYDPTYFIKCKSLIMLCETRLKEIINYIEEESIFDSDLYQRY